MKYCLVRISFFLFIYLDRWQFSFVKLLGKQKILSILLDILFHCAIYSLDHLYIIELY